MAEEVSEFNYLCRLCAKKLLMGFGLPIFHQDIHDEKIKNIDKKIATCLPLQVSMTDQLPKLVCEDCAYKLNEMFEFREKCVETESLFLTMLKDIKYDIVQQTLEDNILPEIHQSIDDIGDLQNGQCHIVVPVDRNDASDNTTETTKTTTIHTMQVMDDMDLAGGEQVVGQEEMSRTDADTARIVNEHIHEVSEHDIAMLNGEMTVVGDLTADGHIAINYVTSIDTESPDQEQIVHYCDDLKFETVPNDTFNQSHEIVGNEIDGAIMHEVDSSVIEANIVPSTSQQSLTQYTKREKHAVLENALNNPTVDELTDANWYVCPFCNEASNEPENLLIHYEQHFCSCSCGLNFTSLTDLSKHKPNCRRKRKNDTTLEKNDITKIELSKNEQEIILTTDDNQQLIFTTEEQPDNDDDDDEDDDKKYNPQQNTNVRQKWTPKICQQCGKQYRTNYKLQEHMRKHTGEKPFKCSTCEKAFRSKIGLAQHTATHTGQFDYSCSTCGKGFQCKSYLIVHQRVHSDLKPYPCDTCGQNFKTKQSLLDHQNRHLGVKPYRCEICGRGFITKGLCKSHQKIHTGEDNRQWPCEVCNKMFVSKSYLNTHLRIHTGEKPYLCEVCGKGFLTRVDLKIHSTMHTGEKSFKCEFNSCNKAFARKSALRCHTRSHNGERPYKCDVCSKTFTQFSPLAIHKRLHSGVKPYVCDVCSKAFVSRSSMMCHKKKHHQVTTATTTSSSSSSSSTTEITSVPIDIPNNNPEKNPDSPEPNIDVQSKTTDVNGE